MSAALAFNEPVTPFLGLHYFTETDSDLFFGRDQQVDELLTRLQGSRFVTVLGSSGSGKSSLVGAGLIPALRAGYLASAGSSWRIARATPGNDPIGNLAACLEERLQVDAPATILRRGPLGLVEAVQRARLPRGENLLVIADQFEELFRYLRSAAGTSSEQHARDEAAAFVKLMLEATVQREVPIYVLLAMRSDFLGDCSQFRNLPERIGQGLYLIPRMRRDQLEQAITGPVYVAGATIAPRLVERLLNEIGDDQDQLPVLQHVLLRMWNFRTPLSPDEPLDLAHYQQVGGLSGALGHHADLIYHSLPARQQQLTCMMFRRLTEVDESREIRRPSTFSELIDATGASDAELTEIIDTFRASGVCFLTQTGNLVDITHESLIRQWGQLREWARVEAADRKEYERFAEAAATDFGRRKWMHGGELERAEKWRKKGLTAGWARSYRGDYQQTVRFIDRSIRAREGERALRLIALVAVIAAIAGFFWWRAGEREKDAAAELRRQQQEQARLTETNKAIKASQDETIKANTRLQATLDLEKQARLDIQQQRIRGTWQSLALGASRDFSRRSDDDRGALLAIQALRLHQRRTASEPRFLVEEQLQSYLAAPDFSHLLTGNQDAALAIAVSPDGHSVVSAGADKLVRVWDVRRHGQPPVTLAPGFGRFTAVAFSPDGHYLAAAGDNIGMNIWDLNQPGNPYASLTGQAKFTAVAFSPDGKSLVAAAEMDGVRLYDLRSLKAGGATFRYLNHNDIVWSVAFAPDGRSLATGSKDGISIWDLERPDGPPRQFARTGVSRVVYTPDGLYLLSAGGEFGVRRRGAGNPLDSFLLFPGIDALSMAVSSDGQYLAAGGRDGKIYFTNLAQLGHDGTRILVGHQGPVTGVAFSPDGRRLFSSSDDKTVRVWDLAGPARSVPAQSATAVTNKVWSVAFSPDGRYLASTGNGGTIRVWDRRKPADPPRVLPSLQGVVTSVAFAPDGFRLASAGVDGSLRVWDLRKNPAAGEVFQDKSDPNPIVSMAVSSDGNHVLIGGDFAAAWIWDVRRPDGEPARFYSDTRRPITAVAYAHGGRRIALARDDGSLEVLDPTLPNAVHRPLAGSRGALFSLAFSPDGQSLAAAGGHDKTVLIWDLAKPEAPTRILTGHAGPVWAVAYSPDGTRIASASEDRTARLWDLRQPNPAPLTIASLPDPVHSVAFSPEGTHVAAGTRDGLVHISPLWTAAAGEICNRVWRNLSREEWDLYVGTDIPYERTCPSLPPGPGIAK